MGFKKSFSREVKSISKIEVELQIKKWLEI